MIIRCAWCGKEADKPTGYVNRAKKQNAPMFCDRVCDGLHRRKPHKTEEENRASKSEYDREYREKNRLKKKAQAHAWYQQNRDPEKEREIRKKNMPRHLEYCRRPEYRKKKEEYDRRYRAERMYGEFAEAYLTLLDIDKEIDSRMTRFEIYAVNERRSAQWRKRQLSSQLQT